jgi:hypothetical protein
LGAKEAINQQQRGLQRVSVCPPQLLNRGHQQQLWDRALQLVLLLLEL